MKQYSSSSLIITTIFLIVIPGCYFGPPKPDGLPETYPCVITVMQSGVPLNGAMVRFSPMDGVQSWSTAGITEEEGRAEIWTYGKWSGAPLGKYKVTVTKNINEGQDNKEITYSLVEKKYTASDSSDLEIEIVKGKNAKTFELGVPVKIKMSD